MYCKMCFMLCWLCVSLCKLFYSLIVSSNIVFTVHKTLYLWGWDISSSYIICLYTKLILVINLHTSVRHVITIQTAVVRTTSARSPFQTGVRDPVTTLADHWQLDYGHGQGGNGIWYAVGGHLKLDIQK